VQSAGDLGDRQAIHQQGLVTSWKRSGEGNLTPAAAQGVLDMQADMAAAIQRVVDDHQAPVDPAEET
jgi:hypothetical protein